jgi:hypothetical protein
MADVHLKTNFEEQDPIRAGFGRGLLDAGKRGTILWVFVRT